MKIVPPNITPGDWTPELPDHGYYDPIAPDGHRVCFIPSRTNRTRQTEANARAIAATPDTLAALAGLVRESGRLPHELDPEVSSHAPLIAAFAALIKAGYTIEE